MPRVFVYGTLMRGQCRAHVLREQRWLGEARTAPRYLLFDTGPYPAMVETVTGVEVEGEVWDVSRECLEILDGIEGVPRLYDRSFIRLTSPSCTDVQAYLYLQPTTGLPLCGTRWSPAGAADQPAGRNASHRELDMTEGASEETADTIRNAAAPSASPRIPYARAWNIGLRTAHIATMSALVGGHVFNVGKPQLLPWLTATIVTGLALVFVEAFPRLRWLYQGRGLFVLFKLFLMCLIPWFWEYRVTVLMAIIVIASVGSHMPGRFRYYSILHRRVLD